MNKLYYFFLALQLTLISCDAGRKNNFGSEELSKEMEGRKLKKVKEADIISKTYLLGDSISEAAQNALMALLTEQLSKNSAANALQYCYSNAIPFTDSLSQAYHVTIDRRTFHPRNKNNLATGLDATLLESYNYNAENGLSMEPNVQQDGDQILYTKAIVIKAGMCLQCHGSENDINEKTFNKINELYPEDQARGYKLDSLRGMWSLKFKKSEIIRLL